MAGVWVLDLGLVPPLASTAYLVDGERVEEAVGNDVDAGSDPAVTLVDAGLRWNRPSLRAELRDAGYGPGDVDRVLLTHYDLDHVGGLPALSPEFDGPVFLGRPDYDLARRAAHPPIAHHKGLFHRVARRLFPFPDGYDVRPVDDGQRIGAFTAHLTPGHNPGHVAYVHDAGVAFLGDLVWNTEGELSLPIAFDSYDVATIEASLRAFVDRVEPFEVAAMAHGTPLRSGGYEALAALAERR